MYLKRLQISGFKTFADATDLEFHPGITAIVGPNGTGKSNISDAIVWALGERSMKALRGAKPLDVIFTGNGGRKGVGMAEVSLTMDNSDNQLPVEFGEVTVTRRIYRNSDTEYFINKTPCRLRDIHELFFDTGIGADTYSIVNQSGIDAVLSIRPEDRRELLEEAAGVKKYRAKRDEARRKLDRTEQNLIRIRDILHEIESQLAPLADQVELALEYENYMTRLRELQLGLLAWEYDVRLKRTDNLKEQRASVEKQVEEGRQRIQELENLEQALDEKRSEMEKQIVVLQQDSTKVVSDVRSTEGQIAVAEERIRSFVEQKELLEQDIRVLTERLRSTRQERQELVANLATLKTECDALIAEVDDKERQFREFTASIASETEQLNRRKSDYIELMRVISDKRNGIASADATHESLQARLRSLDAVTLRTREEQEKIEQSRTDVAAGLSRLREQLAKLEDQLVRARSERDDSEQQRQQLQETLNQTRDELSRIQSRLHTLEEMEQHFEGLYTGVRSVLQASSDQRIAGEYRIVADLLQVPAEYEMAIEVVLGGALQNIVTEDHASATRAIDFLKETRSGRATFLPLDLLRPTPPSDQARSLAQSERARGLATHLVQFDEKYRPAIEYLLNRILIVEDLAAAIELSRRAENHLRLVTLAGEVVIPGGAISGGHGKQSAGGLLARKREMGELRERLIQLKDTVENQTRLLQSLVSAIQESDQQIRGLEAERGETNTALARQDRELEHLEQELRRIGDVLQQIDLDEREVNEEIARSREAREQLQTQLLQLEEDDASLNRTITALQASLDVQITRREELAALVNDARVLQASSEERRTSVQRRIEDIDQASADSEQELKEKEETIASGIEESESLAVRVAGDEMRLELLREHQRAMEQAFDDWRRTRRETGDTLEATTTELRKLRATFHDAEMELHKIEIRETQTQTEMEEMERRFQDDYATTPDQSIGHKEDIQNKQQALDEVETLRQKISGMGEVNVGAVALQKTLQERFEHLSTQKTDIEKAKEELERIIAEIDERTREQFLTTFAAVQVEFQSMFRRIFDGGDTELTLTNPDNLLETGVDITVQLPGKAQQDLLLLSGGERALTALALLMGLLRVKPSPFCILDEVDAPLDENRVERFTELVKEFAQNSQFLIITHNRGTMEAADQLYGVTMEEQGVSKLVSVRLTGTDNR